jgi:hypothetical protein
LQTPYKLPCWNQTKIEILQLTPDSNEEEEGWTVYKEEEFAQKNKNDEQNREEEGLKQRITEEWRIRRRTRCVPFKNNTTFFFKKF